MSAVPREPQDYQAPKARVRKPTKAEMGESDQTLAIVAEVDAETRDDEGTPEGFVAAELCGEKLFVSSQGSWRQSTNDAITNGRLNDWAASALLPESYDRWIELDPTNDEALSFFEDYGRNAGVSLGDTRRSAISSRSTRRR